MPVWVAGTSRSCSCVIILPTARKCSVLESLVLINSFAVTTKSSAGAMNAESDRNPRRVLAVLFNLFKFEWLRGVRLDIGDIRRDLGDCLAVFEGSLYNTYV